MSIDPEINALHNVYEALKGLNTPQIKRIIDWVTSKFHLDKGDRLKKGVAADMYKTLREMGVIDEQQFRDLYLEKYKEAVGAELPVQKYAEIEDTAGLLTGLL